MFADALLTERSRVVEYQNRECIKFNTLRTKMSFQADASRSHLPSMLARGKENDVSQEADGGSLGPWSGFLSYYSYRFVGAFALLS
jgi:hypothetical protein